jgi:hypothetical protein
MNPTTNENYNYDFYEVSYTCLGTQYPNLNNSLFPNITFADQNYIDYVAQNYPNLLSDLQSRTKLPVTSALAYDITPNNIGVEFYVKNWLDVTTVCKEINYDHTYNIDVGNFVNISQETAARESLWNTWWATLNTFIDTSSYVSSYVPSLDFFNIYGRLIVPSSTYITKSGTSSILLSDINKSCKNKYTFTVYFDSFSNTFIAPYGQYFIPNNNWTTTQSINSPYNLEIVCNTVTNNSATFTITIPQNLLADIKSNPSLLNTSFTFTYSIKITIDSTGLVNQIIQVYNPKFYPTNTTLSYNQSIIFNNSQNISTGNIDNILTTINELKALIKTLFINYNEYAQQVSITESYGDLLLFTGRFYDKHGSECSFLLKQVLKPTIIPTTIIEDESLKGFTTSTNETPSTNVPTAIIKPSVSLSSMFNKNRNKLCPTLPQNIKAR